MILPFGAGQQLGDVVVAEAPPQTQRARPGLIGFGGRRLQDLVESEAERGVDDFFERFAQFGRAFPGFGGHIRVERQSGPHAGIMMSQFNLSSGALR